MSIMLAETQTLAKNLNVFYYLNRLKK